MLFGEERLEKLSIAIECKTVEMANKSLPLRIDGGFEQDLVHVCSDSDFFFAHDIDESRALISRKHMPNVR